MKTLLLLLIVGCTITSQGQTGTTVIIIRHAEKDTTQAGSTMMDSDPSLSPAGQQRAARLIEVLKEFKIDSIFSTNYNRTRLTVTPIANARKLAVSLYDPRNQQLLSDHIKATDNKTYLVVGHSNTVVRLVNLLTGSKDPDLADSVYDRIYVVRFTGDATMVYTMHY